MECMNIVPEAFPAVTVPEASLMKAGRSFDKLSTDVSGRGNSSSLKQAYFYLLFHKEKLYTILTFL